MPEDTDRELEFGAAPPGEPRWDLASPERQAFLRYVELTKDKRALERALEDTEKQLATLAAELKDYLGAEGYESVRIAGFTIYLRRELWARKQEWATMEGVCRTLKECGLGHYVKEQFSTSALSKHVRELERTHAEDLESGQIESLADLLPEALAQVLNVEPTYKVVALER